MNIGGTNTSELTIYLTAALRDLVSRPADKMARAVMKNMDDIEKKTGNTRQSFDMLGLSLLFSGMALKRFSESVVRMTTDTFMKISAGATQAGLAITSLGANWTFLKFEIGRAIGEALIPLMPFLIKIISVVSNFAMKHPQGLAYALFGLIAIGTISMFVGQVGMLISALTGVTITRAITNATSLGTALGTLAKIGAIVVGVSFAIAALSDILQGDWAGGIASALMSTGAFVGIKYLKAGGFLMLLGVALELMLNDDFRNKLVKYVASVVGTIAVIFELGLQTLINTAIGAMNSIIRLIPGMSEIKPVTFGTDLQKSMEDYILGTPSINSSSGSQNVKVDITVNQDGRVSNVARSTGSGTSRTRNARGGVDINYSGWGSS